MKKVFLFACVLMIAASSFANKPVVSEKALKAFKSTFTDAENVVWSDVANLYMVKFTQQGISTFVKYDEEGNFVSSRRYYFAEQLPIDIQCTLKKRFADKKVFGVTEYTIGGETNYYIKLEGTKTWTTVKFDNARNMEVTERFEKL